MNKLICFDVDGVLVNTDDEIMVTSWNEYNLWLKSIGLEFAHFTSRIDDIPKKWLKTRIKFSQYASKAFHRVAINPLILSGFNPDQFSSKLIDQLSSADEKLVKECVERVKLVRNKLIKSEGYKDLVKSMPEVDYKWIKQKHDIGELVFITNNPFSIEAFGLIAFRPETNKIRSITSGVHNKATHINEFVRKVSPDRILFIDDKETSLRDVSEGSNLPESNIIQNRWGDTKPAKGYNQLSFSEIKTCFDSM